MSPGFQTKTAKVETSDGHNFTLLEPLVFVTKAGDIIAIPAGATSDGASVPRVFWREIPPFGSYWMAAFLHDWLYRRSDRPKAECDALLLEAMQSLGVERVLADTIYAAVKFFGEAAFLEDRKSVRTA